MHFRSIQQAFFLGLLTIATVLFLWLVQDFLIPVFWAMVFAVIFYPLHMRIFHAVRGHANIASLLTMLIISLTVFVPLTFIGTLVVSESIELYQKITNANNAGAGGQQIDILNRINETLALLQPYGIETQDIQERIPELVGDVSRWLMDRALAFGQGLLHFFLQLFIMMYALFFMLRDGTRWEKKLIEVLPLGDTKERRLFKKFTSTTRATIKGTILIAILEGAIGGVAFWIAGITAPALWGTIMAFFSMIPAVGPVLIWLPAGIILLLTGSIWQGVFILVVGAVIITFTDNLVRPPLVGRDIEMPDILILLSTLGGLSLFGIAGVVLGPIIAAFFLSMWTMFEEDYQDDLLVNK